MKKTLVILLLLLTFVSYSFAGEPTFADIGWTDGNATIIAKINKVQGFAGISPKQNKIHEPLWLCNPDMAILNARIVVKSVSRKIPNVHNVELILIILKQRSLKKKLLPLQNNRKENVSQHVCLN